uniref:Uncharacterized protein n=1 Tax=Chromera velia CCMP2878 TaxID=1169474 RepID=A0A0G4GI64_9ALVE|eukprot:Cvel_22008.t1-p1 / transcript=Cvel_22008.t1 / gene=Cvel_22008 / organism=Chromera_velia_CCMP2878 / gene_product=hypothetical protein / transcript_product=hypothetical protein / location=Cvel_scaffold2122:8915-10574(+) / protein_length=276 / sequence_SO=supercontig / SO=protein_coding / is_pseudo=false
MQALEPPPTEPARNSGGCESSSARKGGWVGGLSGKLHEAVGRADAQIKASCSSLHDSLGAMTLPSLLLSSLLFGTLVGTAAYRKKRVQLDSQIVTRRKRILPSPALKPSPATSQRHEFHSQPSPAIPLSVDSSTGLNAIPRSALSDAAQGVSGSHREKTQTSRLQSYPASIGFNEDEDSDDEEDSGNPWGGLGKGGVQNVKATDLFSPLEILHLFVTPGLVVSAGLFALWLTVKQTCGFHNVRDMIDTIKWVKGVGPPPSCATGANARGSASTANS